MVIRKYLIAKLIFSVLALCPQLSAAEEFQSAQVLEWSRESQNSLFQSSVTMIGIVASQRDDTSHIARCIDGWYWDGDRADSEQNDSIRDAMRRFPDYHPQAVILAVVEKACGNF
jgi:hypothetical protein